MTIFGDIFPLAGGGGVDTVNAATHHYQGAPDAFNVNNLFLVGDNQIYNTGVTGNDSNNRSINGAFLLLRVNSAAASGTISITGTSIDPSTGVPTASDTEDISNLAGANVYQSTKKWLVTTLIDVNSQTINYDIENLNYTTQENTAFSITATNIQILAQGNDPTIRWRIRKFSQNPTTKVLTETTVEDMGVDDAGDDDIVDNLRTGPDDRSYTYPARIMATNTQFIHAQTDYDSYFTSGENVFAEAEGYLIDLLGQGQVNIDKINHIDFDVSTS